MKSKTTTYLLLAVVLVVWGLILWKMFFRKPDDVAYAEPEHKTAVETTVTDTLMFNYRDPFLGAAVKPVRETKLIPQAAEKPAAPQPVPVTHRLRYLGRITRNGVPYGLIEINGTLHTIKTGETVDEYRLRTIWQDSVKIEWRKEVCVVRLGQ